MRTLSGKSAVVIGGSRAVGRAIVAALHAEGVRVLAVARSPGPLAELAAALPGVETLALDAAEDDAPARVFDALDPDLLVHSGGAMPPMQPVHEQDWETFSRNWNTDVKVSFLFSKAALTRPLKPGSTVILISSGAALGGSPISGGYAGSKRMQMFLPTTLKRNRIGRSSVCVSSRSHRCGSCPRPSLVRRQLPATPAISADPKPSS